MKNLSQIIIEKGIKTGGAKITNNVDDASKYDTVKQITKDTETHYISDYGDSSRLLDTLKELGLVEKDKGEGGTLYPNGWNGILTYWISFSDMVTLCKFLVAFNKYFEQFTYDKVQDGKWHMSFDIHDDPLTGIERKTTTFLLQYKSKTKELSEIDKAIDDLCKEMKNTWKK